MFVKKNFFSWRKTKDLRIQVLGYRCEVCGDGTKILVGHHTKGREKVKESCDEHFFENSSCDWQDCQLRCQDCEKELHQLYKMGNSEESQEIQARNNAIIESYLSRERERPDYGQLVIQPAVF